MDPSRSMKHCTNDRDGDEDDETKTVVEKIGNHRRSSRNIRLARRIRGRKRTRALDDKELVRVEDFFRSND